MRSRELSRFALSTCAAAVMLAGCGGSQPPLGAPGAMPQSRPAAATVTIRSTALGSAHDGQQPKAGLIDVNGTLYGTTYGGGKYGGVRSSASSTTGSEKVLHSFNALQVQDGANPSASLIAVKGFCTGRPSMAAAMRTLGTVFKISTTVHEKVLHRFRASMTSATVYDGANPVASLIDVKVNSTARRLAAASTSIMERSSGSA